MIRTLLLFATLATACASSQPKPKDPEPAEPVVDPNAPPKGSVAGGSLAPVEVKKALVAKKEEIKACYH